MVVYKAIVVGERVQAFVRQRLYCWVALRFGTPTTIMLCEVTTIVVGGGCERLYANGYIAVWRYVWVRSVPFWTLLSYELNSFTTANTSLC